jgi:chaperonin GroES
MKGVCKYGYKIYTTPRPHSGAASRRSCTTRGGIVIPDSAKDKPQEGEVISVGKGKTKDEGKLFPLAVREGDRILFGKYSGTEIKIDGEDFLIMKEEEVLGVISGAAKKETVGAKK